MRLADEAPAFGSDGDVPVAPGQPVPVTVAVCNPLAGLDALTLNVPLALPMAPDRASAMALARYCREACPMPTFDPAS